ncbi:MAG: hypothetical protein ACYTFQ_23690, partial [Planctomycetota bacterium]
MKRELWTLLCKDEMRDRYTKQYPPWYANILARSLAPYGVSLSVLTDQYEAVARAAEAGKVKNLFPYAIKPTMTADLQFKPSGWWNKILFYNPEAFPDELIFVDLDSVFIRDPEPIFQYASAGYPMIHERAVFSWALQVPTIASPLFYINPGAKHPTTVWNQFKKETTAPVRDDPKYLPVRMKGDQDFVEYAIQKAFPIREIRLKFCDHWPIEYYSRYKVLYGFKGWEGPGKYYRGYGPERFICHGFNGRPKLEDIVLRKLPGWTSYLSSITEEELETLEGFKDPNARGG